LRHIPEVNSHKLNLVGSMADIDNDRQISDVPNLTETSASEVHEQFRRTEAERVRLAAAAQGAIPRGAVGDPRGAVGGVGGDAPANPRGENGENSQANIQANLRGDQDDRQDAQIEVLVAAVRALTAAQGAGGLGPAHGQAPPEAPAAQGVQMAQNTQELSLTMPVLFYGKCKDGKSIPPNAFLMELKARQTRHGWEPSMLLRFVKSCLRGEAALWWEGCILLYGDDQDQGPAENYAAFKVAFKQHYSIGGATNNLCWVDTFRQRSDEDIREYFLRSTAELGNHLKESAPLLYGKTYTPVDITINGDNTLERVQRRQEIGHDVLDWPPRGARRLRSAHWKTYTPVDITINGDNMLERVQRRQEMGHDVLDRPPRGARRLRSA
jgi:hypothetical protein